MQRCQQPLLHLTEFPSQASGRRVEPEKIDERKTCCSKHIETRRKDSSRFFNIFTIVCAKCSHQLCQVPIALRRSSTWLSEFGQGCVGWNRHCSMHHQVDAEHPKSSEALLKSEPQKVPVHANIQDGQPRKTWMKRFTFRDSARSKPMLLLNFSQVSLVDLPFQIHSLP